jgi:ComF family protein
MIFVHLKYHEYKKFLLICKLLIILVFLLNIFIDFFRLFFPNNCIVCHSSLKGNEEYICLGCLIQVPLIDFKTGLEAIEKVFWGRVKIENIAVYAYFEKKGIIQCLLHELKYRNGKDIGIFLGQLLGKELLKYKRFDEIDVIIPVPLHAQKQRLRGYNQSEEIAKGISRIICKPIANNVLFCTKTTESQTKKTRFKRWENTVEKYRIQQDLEIENKHVLLVDDVITTGATIESCAVQLLSATNVKLSIASIGFTKMQ